MRIGVCVGKAHCHHCHHGPALLPVGRSIKRGNCSRWKQLNLLSVFWVLTSLRFVVSLLTNKLTNCLVGFPLRTIHGHQRFKLTCVSQKSGRRIRTMMTTQWRQLFEATRYLKRCKRTKFCKVQLHTLLCENLYSALKQTRPKCLHKGHSMRSKFQGVTL